MRTKGAETKKLCWNVLIKQGDTVLHNNNYKTLKLAAEDLGLTYSQICELGPSGRCKKKAIKFKFMPDIKITKIDHIGAITDNKPELDIEVAEDESPNAPN